MFCMLKKESISKHNSNRENRDGCKNNPENTSTAK